jgi:prepilin-type N-terminal cleavage/methylation domain-containing protein
MRRHRLSRRRRARRGFSLIEIMTAMTMLAIVLSSLAFLAGQASLRARQVSRNTFRTGLMSELTDRFQAMPFDTLDLYDVTDTVEAGGQRFRRAASVVIVEGSPIKKRITIQLSPVGNDADVQSAVLYRSRPSTDNVLYTP